MKVSYQIIKYFFFLAMIVSLSSCAQSKNILSAKAFFKQSFPGVVISETDMNGREVVKGVDTLHFLFLKVSKGRSAPTIDSIYIGHKLYKIHSSHLLQQKDNLGNTRENGKPITLQNTKNSVWWKFELIPFKSKMTRNSGGNKILVIGHYDKMPFTIRIDKSVEIQPDIRM